MNKKFGKKSGFTLIELLVVIFIIGVLASLLLANLLRARQGAGDAKVKSDAQQLKKALRLYYNDYQSYPPDASDVISDDNPSDDVFQVGTTTYMRDLPDDYVYAVSADGEEFRLIVTLENVSDPEIATSQARCGAEDGGFTGGSFNTVSFEEETAYILCEDWQLVQIVLDLN